jgi:hypothetical protein
MPLNIDTMARTGSRVSLRIWIGIGAVGAVLAGLFVLRPASPAPRDMPSAVAAPADVPPSPKVFELTVANGRLVAGPAVLSVTVGDTVTIGLVADAAEELHLHGYDRKVNLIAGVRAALQFTADRSGRFPYELEHAKKQIGVVEVHPR